MPGDQREVQNAEEEGVIFEWRARQRLRRRSGDWCDGPKGTRHDGTGRQSPEVIEGADYVEEADMVIMALGFEPEDLPTLWNEPELPVNHWGTIKPITSPGRPRSTRPCRGRHRTRGEPCGWAIEDRRDCAQAIMTISTGAHRGG